MDLNSWIGISYALLIIAKIMAFLGFYSETD
jgi:hypothetical protein